MNIKWQYGLFTALILAGLSVLSFMMFRETLWQLVLAEGLIVVLILLGLNIYTKIFRPLDQLKVGSEALSHHDFSNKMRYTDSPEMNNLVSVYNNMIENIRKERVFQQEQHYFLHSLIDALPVGILILDYDGRLSELNPAAKQKLTLNADDIGKPIEKVNPDLAEALSGIAFNEPVRFRIGSNQYFRCLVNKFMHRGFARQFIILEDVSTEVLAIEKKSYGKVIRMMAHEVNNSVGAVNSILDSLLTGSPMAEEEVREYLAVILDRNKNLNRFMQNFADVVRIPPPHLIRTNLNDLIQRVFLLMKTRSDDPVVSMELILPKNKITAQVDPDQIEQVLINVLLNAFQAIKGPGRIIVELDDNPIAIRITDTGSGISAENTSKIFTPFFSTKPSGQGVGLTMVREILNNHRFPYSLHSQGGLTTFEVVLEEEL